MVKLADDLITKKKYTDKQIRKWIYYFEQKFSFKYNSSKQLAVTLVYEKLNKNKNVNEQLYNQICKEVDYIASRIQLLDELKGD